MLTKKICKESTEYYFYSSLLKQHVQEQVTVATAIPTVLFILSFFRGLAHFLYVAQPTQTLASVQLNFPQPFLAQSFSIGPTGKTGFEANNDLTVTALLPSQHTSIQGHQATNTFTVTCRCFSAKRLISCCDS